MGPSRPSPTEFKPSKQRAEVPHPHLADKALGREQSLQPSLAQALNPMAKYLSRARGR